MSSTFFLCFLATRIPWIPYQLRQRILAHRTRQLLQSPLVAQRIRESNRKIHEVSPLLSLQTTNTQQILATLKQSNGIPSVRRRLAETGGFIVYLVGASIVVIKGFPLPPMTQESTTTIALLVGLATWINVEVCKMNLVLFTINGLTWTAVGLLLTITSRSVNNFYRIIV